MPLIPLLLAAALQAGASASAAAPAPVPMQVFIAPSGEPFRAPEGAPYPVAQWFAQADGNHDGRISSSEFVVDFMHFFDSLDTNRDHVLDHAEIAHYENDIAPEARSGDRYGYGGNGGVAGYGSGWHGAARHFQGADGDDGQGDGFGRDVGSWDPDSANARGVPRGAARFDLLALPEPVTAMTPDLDGKVTRDQAETAATNRFAALDTLGRGYLTLDKLPETWVQAHKHWRRHHHRHHR
ncbi:hypothetical protein RXV95_01700 [Novosphingobium sp. ZN18A2]|uniref:hypothetical protein n=1 Tax=Novosphingobium sp. ZN18A2 TaxID=3079861 RepID=UPI0030CC56CA